MFMPFVAIIHGFIFSCLSCVQISVFFFFFFFCFFILFRFPSVYLAPSDWLRML